MGDVVVGEGSRGGFYLGCVLGLLVRSIERLGVTVKSKMVRFALGRESKGVSLEGLRVIKGVEVEDKNEGILVVVKFFEGIFWDYFTVFGRVWIG